MPRIRFTADPKLPRDLVHLGYRKDAEVDLPDDAANRWLRRGVAVVVPQAADTVAAETVAGADTVGHLLDAAETIIAESVGADSVPAETVEGADTVAPAEPPKPRGRRPAAA